MFVTALMIVATMMHAAAGHWYGGGGLHEAVSKQTN